MNALLRVPEGGGGVEEEEEGAFLKVTGIRGGQRKLGVSGGGERGTGEEGGRGGGGFKYGELG